MLTPYRGALHGLDWSTMSSRMRKYGPVPRICYDLFNDHGLERHDHQVHWAVIALSTKQLRELTSSTLSNPSVLYELALVSRCGIEPIGHQTALGWACPIRVEPVSEYVASLLLKELRMREQCWVLCLFPRFNAPLPAGLAGG